MAESASKKVDRWGRVLPHSAPAPCYSKGFPGPTMFTPLASPSSLLHS